jgi:type II secretory pathway pseudopilin PulG
LALPRTLLLFTGRVRSFFLQRPPLAHFFNAIDYPIAFGRPTRITLPPPMQDRRSPRPGDGGARAFRGRRSVVAFTLVELLTVLVIIVALAALSFGSGAMALRERSQRERARADLAALASGLEAFRRHHGAYPRTDRPEDLFAALAGWRNADNATLPARGRRFLEIAGLSLEAAAPDALVNRALDPWGLPYSYVFAPGPDWRATGYLLYSCGPDKLAGAHPGGRAPGAAPEDRDNLYARP